MTGRVPSVGALFRIATAGNWWFVFWFLLNKSWILATKCFFKFLITFDVRSLFESRAVVDVWERVDDKISAVGNRSKLFCRHFLVNDGYFADSLDLEKVFCSCLHDCSLQEEVVFLPCGWSLRGNGKWFSICSYESGSLGLELEGWWEVWFLPKGWRSDS